MKLELPLVCRNAEHGPHKCKPEDVVCVHVEEDIEGLGASQ